MRDSGRGLWRAGFALQLSCNRKRVFWNLHIYVYYYFSTNQMVLQFIEYFTNFFINCDQNVECDWPAGNRLITASLKTCYLYSKLFSFFFFFLFFFFFYLHFYIFISKNFVQNILMTAPLNYVHVIIKCWIYNTTCL